MVTCPRCKNQLEDGTAFCDNCGAPLPGALQPPPAAPSPLPPRAGGGPTCPQCGRPVVAGDAFCENCGAVLSGPAAPHPSRVKKHTAQPVQPSPLNEPCRLVIKSGPNPGDGFDLSKEVTSIGRESDNDIILKDSEISRSHARISRKGGAYVLEDLGSINGTFVNKQPLTAPRALVAGDEIGLGTNVVVTFQGPGAAATSGSSRKLLLGCVIAVVVLCIVALVGAFLFIYLKLYCTAPFDRIFGALEGCRIP
jgi:hypothetical protein